MKAAGNRLPTALSTAYLAGALLFALHASVWALRRHYTDLYYDDWGILDAFFSAPSVPRWLFTDLNGHFIPGTLLLLVLDYTFLAGTMQLLVVASVACLWATVAILGLVYRSDPAPAAISRTSLGFACFALFWAASAHDLPWGINQGTLMAAMWTVVAIACVATTGEGWGRPLAAGVAAACATFSQGLGFSAWAAVLVTAVAGRLPLRVIGGLAVGAGLTMALFQWGLTHRPPGSYAATIRERLPAVLTFAAAFVGAPVGRVVQALREAPAATLHPSSVVAGTVGMALFAICLVATLARPARRSPRDLLALGLMTAATVGGVMVALNRLPWPTAAVHQRFATWPVLFWIGTACALPSLLGRSAHRGIVQTLAVVLIALVSASMLPSLARARIEQRALATELSGAATMHLLGIQWDILAGPDMRGPVPDRCYRVVARLKADARNLFADERASLPGKHLDEQRYPAVDAARCAGKVTWWRHVPARNQPALQLAGWGVDADGKDPLSFVVITDSQGIVRGLGADDARFSRIAGPPMDHPWSGFIAGYQAAERYQVWGILADGRSACPLVSFGGV